jgi:AcrR family transcriptional regulator
MSKDTKQRMIESAAELLRTRGLSAMSFTDITADSGAPRGVIYHHFPEGKVELARDAVVWTGLNVLEHLNAMTADSPIEFVDRFLRAIRGPVRESSYGASCAVAAVTIEAKADDGPLAGAADAAFESWIGALRTKFVAFGVSRATAVDLATLLIVVLQGSHILARASGNLKQFDRTVRATRAAAGALLAAGGSATH